MKSQMKTLFERAKEASGYAYSPYSKFMVGAALLCKSGKVYLGCNVENASYGSTICAERVAVCKAVSEGDMEFEAIAVYVQSDMVFPPCGICRQFLAEFSSDIIVVYGNENVVHETDIKGLLPESFRLMK